MARGDDPGAVRPNHLGWISHEKRDENADTGQNDEADLWKIHASADGFVNSGGKAKHTYVPLETKAFGGKSEIESVSKGEYAMANL